MSSSSSTAAASRVLLGPAAGSAEASARYVAEPRSAPRRTSEAGVHARRMLVRLRRALAADAFVLHFQPIVSLRDDTVVQHEALLRLADRGPGRLEPPAGFLATAERYGLIADIDRMVVARVIRMLASDRTRPDSCIAVNLSAVSVTDPAMLGHLARRLAWHRVDPSRLVLEVTETAAICDMDRARAFCAGAQALGCAIALDDFGAGFGSFQYLKQLPFTHLKIDGGFVRGLTRSRTDQLVVQAMVALASGMGRLTTAEFVGDAATIEMLRGFGVDHAQGYGIAPPHAALALAA